MATDNFHYATWNGSYSDAQLEEKTTARPTSPANGNHVSSILLIIALAPIIQ